MTVEVPGGRELLTRTEEVRVIHDGRSGMVERPSLVAAVVGRLIRAAAWARTR
jgi:hypothetical protein